MVESSGRHFPLGEGQSWAIGRGDGCAVMLDSRSVSRLHALIQRRDAGDLSLVDLGSRNGSFVNGTRVSFPVTLNDNDKLLFGDQPLTFRNPARQPSFLHSPFFILRSAFFASAASCSVCHRYHDATDRYGRQASPIFDTRFASGRLRSR